MSSPNKWEFPPYCHCSPLPQSVYHRVLANTSLDPLPTLFRFSPHAGLTRAPQFWTSQIDPCHPFTSHPARRTSSWFSAHPGADGVVGAHNAVNGPCLTAISNMDGGVGIEERCLDTSRRSRWRLTSWGRSGPSISSICGVGRRAHAHMDSVGTLEPQTTLPRRRLVTLPSVRNIPYAKWI